MKFLTSFYMLFTFIYGQTNNSSWNNCTPCKCSLRPGYKYADCKLRPILQLYEVPKNFSSEIEEIDFGNQNITQIKDFEFTNASLYNLKKIWFPNCEISYVSKNSFKNLTSLQEISLSGNYIEELQPGTFEDNRLLERIYLRKNKIKKIGPKVFSDLKHLLSIELSDNLIENIDKDAFKNNINLSELRLDNNKLKILNQEVIVHLTSYNLRTMTLYNNPWYCNCFLQHSINILKEKNLLTPREVCDFPESLKGRALVNLSSNDIHCTPQVFLKPDLGVKFVQSGDNLTLTCDIYSNVDLYYWTFNKEPTSNCMENFNCNQNYVKMEKEDFGEYLEVNITKNNVTDLDSGLYGCYAQNQFGLKENFIAVVVKDMKNNIQESNDENQIFKADRIHHKHHGQVEKTVKRNKTIPEESQRIMQRTIPLFEKEREDMEKQIITEENTKKDESGHTMSYIVFSFIAVLCAYAVISTGLLFYFRYKYKLVEHTMNHHYEEIRDNSFSSSTFYNARKLHIGEPQDFRRVSVSEDGEKIYLEPKPAPRSRTEPRTEL